MLKNEDVENDADDDDEVRTSESQNCVTATLSTEKFFLLARPPYCKTGFTKSIQLLCDRED
jgi:hypothetical protein